jgi:predicted TIM-barrel fold metal-dependent hydrolase
VSALDGGASRLLVISSDCHAGALPATYNDYLPKRFHGEANAWWLAYAREMMSRAGTFFDQEAVDAYAEKAGEGGARMRAWSDPDVQIPDDEIVRMLSDASSPFAPRRGEFDMGVRKRELDADGIAGEVIFPQMAPFGAGLLQYRFAVTPEQSFAGCQAYNRWLADFCSADPGRHAGVALVDVEDIGATVREVRAAKEMGLWGGVLLPTSTGAHPFYHHPRYEPLWAACEELELPLQSHSGWSPDYGDVASATAMYITEVDMFAQRPFAALVWSGAFERHPRLKYILTETGVGWVVEKLRVLEFKADNPIFKHFTKRLSLSPAGYFARQCFLGASFMPFHEGQFRDSIGVDKLMWGSDYPHLEGTWPNTLKALRETFSTYPEEEVRAMLGENAARVYGFDADALQRVADEIGPTLAEIRGEA